MESEAANARGEKHVKKGVPKSLERPFLFSSHTLCWYKGGRSNKTATWKGTFLIPVFGLHRVSKYVYHCLELKPVLTVDKRDCSASMQLSHPSQ
eukprot:6467671-Amphidinium_carterae.2